MAQKLIAYNYANMRKTSETLLKLFEDGNYSEDILNTFRTEALSLEWEGYSADNFREEVNSTLAKIQLNSELTDGLRWKLGYLAEYPRSCANILEANLKH